MDVSTRKIAIGGIRDGGKIVTSVLELDPDARGARRLVGARLTAFAAFGAYRTECGACAVEIPLIKRADLRLLGVAAVVLEAAQAAMPGTVVMDVPVARWKKGALGDGHGNADKAEVMAHALTLGYQGSDQDVADALVIADYARGLWERATAGAAA